MSLITVFIAMVFLHSLVSGLARLRSHMRELSLALLWMGPALPIFAADLSSPMVATNHIVVTNVVVVTITNYVFATPSISATTITNTTLPPLSWSPPQDAFDWVQLKSGEWLKGKIKAMQDRKLEFDSEELDVLTFDWKDIRQLRSRSIQDVLSVDGQTVSGQVTITPKEVTVNDGATEHDFPRDQLQSVTPGGTLERDHWSGKLTLSLGLRAGNTEQVDYTAQAHLQRRTPATRLSLDYIGNFSRTDGTENANNQRVNSEFDLWLSRRLYLILPFAEYYSDPFQNLKTRLTGGVGVGYDVVDRRTVQWSISAGPAYQYTEFNSVQPGEATSKNTGALVLGSNFEWDITSRIELTLEYSGQFTSREAGETTQHSVNTLSFELTKRFDLDISFTWDRVGNPQPGSDGVQPKPNDFRLLLGLGMDF